MKIGHVGGTPTLVFTKYMVILYIIKFKHFSLFKIPNCSKATDLCDHGVHVDALHEVECEGGRVEEVDADAHVAASPVHHQHFWVVVRVYSVMTR